MGAGQVSPYPGYSRQGLINLARDGKIRAVKTGAGWIYDPDSVEAFRTSIAARKRDEGR